MRQASPQPHAALPIPTAGVRRAGGAALTSRSRTWCRLRRRSSCASGRQVQRLEAQAQAVALALERARAEHDPAAEQLVTRRSVLSRQLEGANAELRAPLRAAATSEWSPGTNRGAMPRS
jgi:hypothetical protein